MMIKKRKKLILLAVMFILIAIGILSFFYVYVSRNLPGPMAIADMGIKKERNNYNVTITNVLLCHCQHLTVERKLNMIRLENVRYSYNGTSGDWGEVDTILNRTGSPISFYDDDCDRYLSKGDYFLLNISYVKTIPPAQGTFLVKTHLDYAGSVIGRIYLSGDGWVSMDIERTNRNYIVHVTNVFFFDTNLTEIEKDSMMRLENVYYFYGGKVEDCSDNIVVILNKSDWALSFYDNDNNGVLSTGDYFIITVESVRTSRFSVARLTIRLQLDPTFSKPSQIISIVSFEEQS